MNSFGNGHPSSICGTSLSGKLLKLIMLLCKIASCKLEAFLATVTFIIVFKLKHFANVSLVNCRETSRLRGTSKLTVAGRIGMHQDAENNDKDINYRGFNVKIYSSQEEQIETQEDIHVGAERSIGKSIDRPIDYRQNYF